MRLNRAKIKNILVVRNDRFGEFLLNIPALRAVKESFPGATVTAVVSPVVRELARAIKYIDAIKEWAPGRHSLKEKLSLLTWLKASRFELAIMLNPSKDFNLFTFIAGIPLRVGYDRKWGFLLTHKMKDTKYLSLEHEVDYNLDLVGLVGAQTQDKGLSLTIDQAWEKTSISLDGVILHPWTSDPLKQWPLKNFRALTERIIHELNIKVIIVGGKENIAKDREFFSEHSPTLIDITGKTSIGELAALLKQGRLLVSGDSGPVHLSCAVGTPVIALFRNDIPGKSAKRWGPWLRGSAVIEKNSLSDITVEEVFNKVKEMLG